MHTDKELKRWEGNVQSFYRTGCLSPRKTLIAEQAGIVWRDAVANITKEMCIAELKRVAKQLGRTPKYSEFIEHASISMGPLEKLFGSWRECLTSVGLNAYYIASTDLNKSTISEEIKRVATLIGHSPTSKEFDTHASMCSVTASKFFGKSWTGALKAAGLIPNVAAAGTTKAQVITELNRVATLVGHTPTREELSTHARISTTPIYNLFGSWNACMKAAGLVLKRVVGCTKSQVLTELKRVANLLGRTPTQTEFNKHAYLHSATVARLFGKSYNSALKAAKLNLVFSGTSHKTKVLAEIKRVAKLLKHTPSTSEFNRHANISVGPVSFHFGNYTNGLKAAGLPLARNQIKNAIDKPKALSELKRVAKLLGHTPITVEFDKHASIHSGSVIRLFGSWSRGLKVADLVLNRVMGRTKTQVITELKRVAKQLGHTPTTEEFNEYASMSCSLVQHLFGSWNGGLKTAGLVTNTMTGVTKIQALTELKRVAKLLGHTPTKVEFDEYTNAASSTTVAKLVGTWSKALVKVGLTPNQSKW